MGAAVQAQVDQFEGGPGDGPGRLLDGGAVEGAEGEDGAVVVGVGVEVEEQVTGGRRQRVEDGPVAALADVDDALETAAGFDRRRAQRAPTPLPWRRRWRSMRRRSRSDAPPHTP